jgi:hypothetical protein
MFEIVNGCRCLQPFLAKRRDSRVGGLLGAIGDHDGGPLAGHPQRGGKADPLRRARDDCDLSGEPSATYHLRSPRQADVPHRSGLSMPAGDKAT